MNTLTSMKVAVCRPLILGVIAAFVAFPAHAAPSLAITKPPVISGPDPDTGPAPTDPLAAQGQWFQVRVPNTGLIALEPRSYQFHDNEIGHGGGAASTKAIFGFVSSIVYAGGNIVDFDITATITNDTASASGVGLPGHNSHGESLVPVSAAPTYKGPLVSPILVADFALAGPAIFPPGPLTGTPYVVFPGPRIVATNSYITAWYCFNNVVPSGGYYVPGWSFPTINIGASATAALDFQVLGGGLPPSDPRFAAIVQSFVSHTDILSSRTTSLKISHWVSGLSLDTGAASISSSGSSDVEVFHDILPTP
jgi:hypothetical protein